MNTKHELGIKRTCPECGARFYDLGRQPARCPKCGHEFIPEDVLKPRKPRKDSDAEEGTEPARDNEVSLETADTENATAQSKRLPSLDGAETGEDDDHKLDENNDHAADTLDNGNLLDQEEENDMDGIITPPDDRDD